MAKYHHGNLREQVLSTASELIASRGADALSLRDLARRAGVSHAAPAHHFGDRRGLFTALATQGFELLAVDLEGSVAQRAFDRTAVAYVRFAVARPGHFAVMFRSDLLDPTAPSLARARERAADVLRTGLAGLDQDRLLISADDARRAAWAMVHGVATLWLAGALPGVDPEQLALSAAHQLFGPAGSGADGS